MKNSWINKWAGPLLALLLCLPIFAQEETEPVAAQQEEPQQEEVSQAEPKPTEMTAEEKQRLADGEAIAEIFSILRAFQPEEAAVAIENSKINKSMKNLFMGWVRHQQGRYGDAVKRFDKVDSKTLKGEDFLLNRLDELRKTGVALQKFERLETENFVLLYKEGLDRVMTYYLPEILEQIYAAYSPMFDFQRTDKIIVELMPDHELFSYASALSRKQIETTGTIALCVENRLVVLTPRRVLQGYEWADTIAHEFIHYILSRKSRDHAPLWFQEGVAKYFEARWRENDGSFLDPGMESSLAQAITAEKFLTIQQMMPSFAALPTAALARQAYAQTASMVDYLVEKKDLSVVRAIAEELKSEPEMDEVLQTVIEMNFEEFESSWQEWAKNQGYRSFDTVAEGGVTLLDKDESGSEIKEANPEDDAAKKHTRLGDLLLERHRYQAALKEYKKAITGNKKPNRQLSLRVLTCMEALDLAEEMIQFIETQVMFPDRDTTMLGYMAEGHLRQNKLDEAKALLDRAININPFNPSIHRKMLATYDKNKEAEAVRKTEEIIAILTSPPKKAASKKEEKSKS